MTEMDLPPPPVSAEVDLTSFTYMPLEVSRLRRSKAWLVCKRRPDLAFYMMNLWTASWHEIPAGSLEDDDDVLANFAMCSPERWPKVRADVMRGWVKCSDGRLYHPVVVEKVRESWRSKLQHEYDKECGRLRKAWTRTKQPGTFDPPSFEQWEVTRMSKGRPWKSNGHSASNGVTSVDVQWTSQGSPAENALKVRERKGKGEVRDMYVGHTCPEDVPCTACQSEPAVDPHQALELIQATYPRFTGRQDWTAAAHHCGVLTDRDGVGWHELMAGVERYAAFVAAGGVSGPQYVMTPAKFFSGADKPWSQSWDPPPTKGQLKQDANLDAARQWLAESGDT